MTSFTGKVVFITGAARGQGRNHARRFAAAGADVVALDICRQLDSVPYPMPSSADLDETARLVEKEGARCLPIVADIRDRTGLVDAVTGAVAEFGRLDVVLANAGICPLLDTDAENAWRDVIDVNLTGTQNTLAATAPAILAGGRGGSIILTSSGLGASAYGTVREGALGYIASKHGQIGLMRSYANQLAADNIRVNAILPSGVATPMVVAPTDEDPEAFAPSLAAFHGSLRDPGGHKNMLPVSLMGVDDMSDAVLWLASEQARFVTGAAIPVDAGYLNS